MEIFGFDVRKRMEEIMEEKNISREELAKAMGCSRRAVIYWCNHQRAFNEDWILHLCEALDMTPNEFFKVDKESDKDFFVRLCHLDNDTLERKLADIRKKEFLISLALQSKDKNFLEQWNGVIGEACSDT